jgi:hypothetical protein
LLDKEIAVLHRGVRDFGRPQITKVIHAHAVETYAELKDEYLIIKAMLNVVGVNLSEIGKIKE